MFGVFAAVILYLRNSREKLKIQHTTNIFSHQGFFKSQAIEARTIPDYNPVRLNNPPT